MCKLCVFLGTFLAMYCNSSLTRSDENWFTFLTLSDPSTQNVHENGQPLLVCIIGTNLPSKNSSRIPVRYGEGISSSSLTLFSENSNSSFP